RPNGYRQACRYLLVDVACVEDRTFHANNNPATRGGRLPSTSSPPVLHIVPVLKWACPGSDGWRGRAITARLWADALGIVPAAVLAALSGALSRSSRGRRCACGPAVVCWHER